MATREQILAAIKKNPDVSLYNDSKRGVIISSSEPYASPTWGTDRKRTTRTAESFSAKGVPDSSGGSRVTVTDVDGKKVISGYEPYSCPEWFRDARKQGVDKYDD